MPTFLCTRCKAGIEAETPPARCPACNARLSKPEPPAPEPKSEGSDELLQWESRFKIGNPHIDAQHQELVEIINELYRAVKHHQYEPGFIPQSLKRLDEYTKVHFAEEESLFKSTKYPLVEEHVKQHVEFMAWILVLRAKSKENFVDIKPMLKHLVEWFIKHTQTLDRGYMSYL
jgi:hemerythrin-like metal-binding protein